MFCDSSRSYCILYLKLLVIEKKQDSRISEHEIEIKNAVLYCLKMNEQNKAIYLKT